jgi:SAM-dependent methyltransferase
MKANIGRYLDPEKLLLFVDIGSRDVTPYRKSIPQKDRVGGSFRYLIVGEYAMSDKWRYIGVDLVEGKNVDMVMPAPYEIPLPSGVVDVVISGNCFEHVENPFRLMAEATRILKPGGWVLVTAPFMHSEHRYPIDCWRFLPDGWNAVFKEARLRTHKVYRRGADCWGVAVKPGGTKEPR